MKILDQLCEELNRKINYWRGLEEFCYFYPATIELEELIEVNGVSYKKFIGYIGPAQTIPVKINVIAKCLDIKGWDVNIKSAVRSSHDKLEYLECNEFIPFEKVGKIIMKNPSKNNKILMTRSK